MVMLDTVVYFVCLNSILCFCLFCDEYDIDIVVLNDRDAFSFSDIGNQMELAASDAVITVMENRINVERLNFIFRMSHIKCTFGFRNTKTVDPTANVGSIYGTIFT